jgi:[ribosomal protein S5]-alanine N-acetyltransferase
MTSTVLTTDRLILRPWQLEDIATFAALSNDPEIADHTLSSVCPQPDGWAQTRVERMIASFTERKNFSFAVMRKDTAEVIADCGISFDERHKRGEMGYWCGAAYRGHGFMTESARAVMQFGFEQLGLHRVQASHFPRNPASARILEKIGMQREGLLRGYVQKNGQAEDVIYYAALKSDLPSSSLPR